jgi:glycosyltransferase involved in cell wall biosynthesis
MLTSFVVRTKDEAPRPADAPSLARQTQKAEVVVVNDGSTDATPQVLDEARARLDLTVVTRPQPFRRVERVAPRAATSSCSSTATRSLRRRGRAVPAMHRAAAHGGTVGRGEFHFRGTRFFLDPETGTPRPGEEARRAPVRGQLERIKTRDGRAGFRRSRGAPSRRYPGAGPRRLQELESTRCAAIGLHGAVGRCLRLEPRAARPFAAGGYGPMRSTATSTASLRSNLRARRMTASRARAVPPDASRRLARCARMGWERCSGAAPDSAVKILPVFWAHRLVPDVPEGARLASLPELRRRARRSRRRLGRGPARIGLPNPLPGPTADLA